MKKEEDVIYYWSNSVEIFCLWFHSHETLLNITFMSHAVPSKTHELEMSKTSLLHLPVTFPCSIKRNVIHHIWISLYPNLTRIFDHVAKPSSFFGKTAHWASPFRLWQVSIHKQSPHRIFSCYGTSPYFVGSSTNSTWELGTQACHAFHKQPCWIDRLIDRQAILLWKLISSHARLSKSN